MRVLVFRGTDVVPLQSPVQGAPAQPQILGGPSSLWFTQIIYQWFNTGGNWPRGSAYAIVLLVACIAFVLLVMKLFKVRLGEIGK